MVEKNCRGGFLESLCQWVALQNQQYGRNSNARAWGWNSSADTALTECCTSPMDWIWALWGCCSLASGSREAAGRGEEQGQGQARKHHQKVQGAVMVWGRPSQQDCKSIQVHVGQSQFMSMWITSSKVGAAPQLPMLSYCDVLSAAKSHVKCHPKM